MSMLKWKDYVKRERVFKDSILQCNERRASIFHIVVRFLFLFALKNAIIKLRTTIIVLLCPQKDEKYLQRYNIAF